MLLNIIACHAVIKLCASHIEALSICDYPLVMKILRELYLIPVYIYKLLISPFTGPCCRYTPSCSIYMMEAVKKYGIIKGTIMGTARLLRCRKSFLGGPDPVPDEWSWQRIKSDWEAYRIRNR